MSYKIAQNGCVEYLDLKYKGIYIYIGGISHKKGRGSYTFRQGLPFLAWNDVRTWGPSLTSQVIICSNGIGVLTQGCKRPTICSSGGICFFFKKYPSLQKTYIPPELQMGSP